jgi:peptidoglycan hydrolase CwlO-like protein
MKKLLILGIIGAVALVAIVKKTNVCSYASTLASTVGAQAKDQVPTKFELERIRNEIAALDGDISQMIRPIAEYKSAIEKMRKDIAKGETNITTRKKDLLDVVKELEANKPFKVNDRVYTPEQVRRQVERDTTSLKQLEKHVKAQQQVLDAKELSLKATQEQLAKVISKKREYEIRLAQVEAEEETLQVARIGSTVKIDNTRATQIEDALAAIEQRHDVERHETILRTNDLVNVPLQDRNRTPDDLNAIRNYLEGNEPADKTASNK